MLSVAGCITSNMRVSACFTPRSNNLSGELCHYYGVTMLYLSSGKESKAP